MLGHIRRENALLHAPLEQIVLVGRQSTEQLHSLNALEAFCEMKLLLAGSRAVLEKPLRFLRDMVAVHEAIVGVIVAQSCDNDCELVERAQPQLDREAVRPVLKKQVCHLGNV